MRTGCKAIGWVSIFAIGNFAGCPNAAELSLDFDELATLLTAGVAHSNIVAVSERDATETRSASASGPQVVLTFAERGASRALMRMPAPEIILAGARYRLVPRVPSSLRLAISPAAAGLRLDIAARDEVLPIEVICMSGACIPDGLRPYLVWQSPRLIVGLEIRSSVRGLTFRIGELQTYGSIRLECGPSWLVERALCGLAAVFIEPGSDQMAADLAGARGDFELAEVNRLLGAWLMTAGGVSAGSISQIAPKVTGIAADEARVSVSFCLGNSCD